MWDHRPDERKNLTSAVKQVRIKQDGIGLILSILIGTYTPNGHDCSVAPASHIEYRYSEYLRTTTSVIGLTVWISKNFMLKNFSCFCLFLSPVPSQPISSRCDPDASSGLVLNSSELIENYRTYPCSPHSNTHTPVLRNLDELNNRVASVHDSNAKNLENHDAPKMPSDSSINIESEAKSKISNYDDLNINVRTNLLHIWTYIMANAAKQREKEMIAIDAPVRNQPIWTPLQLFSSLFLGDHFHRFPPNDSYESCSTRPLWQRYHRTLHEVFVARALASWRIPIP